MVKKPILGRDMFVNEAFSGKDEEQINEGVLDFFRSVLGREWKKIKTKNESVKDALKDVDKSLGGFSYVKLSKAGQCKQIRQILCDYANTLLDFKLKEFEDNKDLQKTLMTLKNAKEVTPNDKKKIAQAGDAAEFLSKYDIKDKSLRDKLDSYDKQLKTATEGDPDLKKWANLMKEGIRNIINDYLIAEYEKTAKDKKKEDLKAAKEQVAKDKEEEAKIRKEQNTKAKKEQEKKIEELEDQRKKLMSNLGVSLYNGQDGEKALGNLISEFEKIYKSLPVSTNEGRALSFAEFINEGVKKDLKNVLGGDTYFGLADLTKDEKVDDKVATLIVKLLYTVFASVDGVLKYDRTALKNLPSDAVQALFFGISKLIQNAILEDKPEIDDDLLELTARLAIDSDKTIGYGLPLADPKKPKEGNTFAALMGKLVTLDNGDKNSKVAELFVDNKELENKFKQNLSKMFDKIRAHAKDIIKKKQQEDEQAAEQEDKK